MSKAYNMEKIKRKITDSNLGIEAGKRNLQSIVYDTTLWWSGEPGKEIRNQYSDIQTDVNLLCKKITGIHNTIGNLMRDVDKAEDEREKKKENALV